MTDQKLREQAERLFEKEQEELRRREEQEREADRERGILSYVEKIKKDDAERERQQARRAAADEAETLARQRYALAQRIEDHATTLNDALGEYVALHERHVAAMVRAGLDRNEVGALRRRFRSMLPTWAKDRFGGRGSVLGIEGTRRDSFGHAGERIPTPLAARDELAARREDDGAA